MKVESESAGPRAAPPPRLGRTLVIVGVTSLLTDLSSELVYPLIPFLVVGSLGASVTVLGVIEGLAESLPALVKVLSGRLSDRLGRRKPLAVGGYALSALGKIVLAIAGGWAPVLFGRVTDRLGKGIRSAPRDALIADTTHHQHRGHAFGFHKMMDTTGAALGVLAAYIILTTISGQASERDGPIRTALWVSVIPAVIAVLALMLVRESKSTAAPSSEATLPRHRISWKKLPLRLRYFLVVSFLFSIAGSTNLFLLLRAQNLLSGHGDSPITAAATACLFYLLYNLVYAASSYPFGRISDRVGRKPVLVAGYALYACVYGAFALNTRADWCWLLFGIYGLFPALTEGVEKALVSDLAPRNSRATILGLHGTLQAVGLFPASVIGGILWDSISPEATFWFAGAIGMAAAIGLAFLPATPLGPKTPQPEPG